MPCPNPPHHHHQFASLDLAYQQLGLSIDASLAQVKQAYRHLALQCHPDLHGKGNEEFVRITAAYERIVGRDVRALHSPSSTVHPPVSYRSYPAQKRFDGRAATVWGFGLALGCVLFGSILLWSRTQIHRNGYLRKGPTMVVEPSFDTKKRERIASILLEKRSKQKEKGA